MAVSVAEPKCCEYEQDYSNNNILNGCRMSHCDAYHPRYGVCVRQSCVEGNYSLKTNHGGRGGGSHTVSVTETIT